VDSCAEQESVYNQSKYWLIEDDEESRLNKQFLHCAQTSNLRNNFLYWDAKSRDKQQTSVKQSNDNNQSDKKQQTDES